jgi:predicted DNA-binding protein
MAGAGVGRRHGAPFFVLDMVTVHGISYETYYNQYDKGCNLTRLKARTSITIPENLLSELDRKASEQGRTRSDMVCEAVSAYFAEEEEKLLAEGYKEFASESTETDTGAGGCWPESWPEC